MLTAAILDQLMRHAQIIQIQGESYRLKDKRKAGIVVPAKQKEIAVAKTHHSGLGRALDIGGLCASKRVIAKVGSVSTGQLAHFPTTVDSAYVRKKL